LPECIKLNGCSLAIVSGQSPIHAPGKKSKKGRLSLNRRNGQIVTLCGQERQEADDFLVPVFKNGKLLKEWSWDEVRGRAAVNMATYDSWGPTVAEKAAVLLEEYKTGLDYTKDIKSMQVADSEYSGPWLQPVLAPLRKLN
jgi:hypothetical protein